ncbi:MAG: peptidase, partial [Acidobacteria bacterium]|nr:peptidase [Acidobacteriota bacterium]
MPQDPFRFHRLVPFALLLGLAACTASDQPPAPDPIQAEAEDFLTSYTQEYTRLYTAASEAEWQANIRIVEGDDTNRLRSEETQQAKAVFTGSAKNIETTRRLLEAKDRLSPL